MQTRLVIAAVFGLVVALPASAQVYLPQQSAAYPYAYGCPVLSYNLYRGATDAYTRGEVSQLQQFLASRGYHQPVTGYFGAITAANVAAFQRGQGVYPVTGGVGPLTRAAIQRVCGGYIPPTPAPAGVTVTAPLHGSSYVSGQTVNISWTTGYQPYLSPYAKYASPTATLDLYRADGTLVGTIAMGAQMSGSYQWSVPTAGTICTLQYPNGLCGQSLSGQYFIKVSINSGLPGGGLPGQGLPGGGGATVASGNSGTITINTSAQQQASLTAWPQSGTAPLAVSFTGQVYDGGTYALEYGDGASEAVQVPAIACTAIAAPCYPPAFTRSHTYHTQGVFLVRLLDHAGKVLATRTVSVAGGCSPYHYYGCQ